MLVFLGKFDAKPVVDPFNGALGVGNQLIVGDQCVLVFRKVFQVSMGVDVPMARLLHDDFRAGLGVFFLGIAIGFPVVGIHTDRGGDDPVRGTHQVDEFGVRETLQQGADFGGVGGAFGDIALTAVRIDMAF